MKDVIFWGATGQARVLREALASTEFQLLAIFDNKPRPSPFPDVPVYLGHEGLSFWLANQAMPMKLYACVAIGGGRGIERLTLQQLLQGHGMQPLTVIHHRAFVASDAEIGEGSQILAMSAVCANVTVGRAVIVNTCASIDHDCVIESGVHIGPGAHLAGEVHVSEYAFVGTGATVSPRVNIGRCAVVGAGAVVVRDVAAGETVVGNPAKPITRSRPLDTHNQ